MRHVLLPCAFMLAWPAGASAAAIAKNQGFRSLKDGSEVFVIVDRKTEPQLKQTAGGVQLVLPNTRMKRPFRFMETRYFPTPVKLVTAIKRDHDLVIDIVLKEKVEPKLGEKKQKHGSQITLWFPPGVPDQTPPPKPKATKGGDDEAPDAVQSTKTLSSPVRGEGTNQETTAPAAGKGEGQEGGESRVKMPKSSTVNAQ